MNFSELYISRLADNRLNTSYPVSRYDWAKYKSTKPLDFSDEKELSFYIHIPFCRQLCSFCEYSRMICPSAAEQMSYLAVVQKDIQKFLEDYSFALRGLDIGGGTPTSLSDEAFDVLMGIYRDIYAALPHTDDYEPSIEGTFDTCTESKLRAIAQSGIRRLSLGVQATDKSLLHSFHRRAVSFEQMQSVIAQAKSHGIEKINLDLMYGLPGQTIDTIEQNMHIVERLKPEQITLYELRTNQLSASWQTDKDELYRFYCYLYDHLVALGYYAHFGQNTFSQDKSDFGVSSYLRSRMLDGTAYKGFGLSAQSMCRNGVSYNRGKIQTISSLDLKENSFENGDIYLLPATEWANKYIAIAGYANRYSTRILNQHLSENEMSLLQERIDYLLKYHLLVQDGEYLSVPRSAFKDYGAINSMLRL